MVLDSIDMHSCHMSFQPLHFGIPQGLCKGAKISRIDGDLLVESFAHFGHVDERSQLL